MVRFLRLFHGATPDGAAKWVVDVPNSVRKSKFYLAKLPGAGEVMTKAIWFRTFRQNLRCFQSAGDNAVNRYD